ncbi:Hypothetical_protein [Hexamita inflata]|uniref:Hypothetical_protein n=1 Tax=Hexamita inflata TaxID=28002 RepID=A0AA86UIJ0_9EUKA|nr:Hypothetical protein HINF_LOCUS40217 [Hexamita inflata]
MFKINSKKLIIPQILSNPNSLRNSIETYTELISSSQPLSKNKSVERFPSFVSSSQNECKSEFCSLKYLIRSQNEILNDCETKTEYLQNCFDITEMNVSKMAVHAAKLLKFTKKMVKK